MQIVVKMQNRNRDKREKIVKTEINKLGNIHKSMIVRKIITKNRIKLVKKSAKCIKHNFGTLFHE